MRMGLSRSRSITLVVAIATLTSNILSSLLFSQLPDDPYHLASNFGWYLHFANILSVFGFIGAVRVSSSTSPDKSHVTSPTLSPRTSKSNSRKQQHALSIAIFSNYLILDTILCAIPRFLLLSLLQPLSTSLCTPSDSEFPYHQQTTPHNTLIQQPAPSLSSPSPQWDSLSAYTANWTPDSCFKIVYLAQVTLFASVVAATLLQFVGALCVREYAKMLWMREIREEERVLAFVERRSIAEERGLSVIEEEYEDEAGEKAV